MTAKKKSKYIEPFHKPLRILFLGSGERGYHCLEKIDKIHDIVGIIMENDDTKKYKDDATYRYAMKNDIKVHKPISFKQGSAGYTILEDLQPDIAVLCVYEKILPKDFINFFSFKGRKGCINLHGGKVPQYRGASVLRWQLRNNEVEGAFTILDVSGEIDDCDILGEYRYKITREMTVNDVIKIEHKIFPQLLVSVLYDIQIGKVRRREQKGLACYWHKIQEYDRQIDWKTMTADTIYDLVRSETKPYPGAFFYLNDIKTIHTMIDSTLKKVRVWDCELIKDKLFSGTPGRVVATYSDGSVVVICQDRGLMIKTVSTDGDKAILPARDMLKVRMQL